MTTVNLNNLKIGHPRAVILCGISGSGKTRIARKFEQEGYRRLSLDHALLKKHGDGFTSFPSEEQRMLTIGMEKELCREMCQLLERGESVVVDACLCKRFKRDAFMCGARRSGVEPTGIFATAPDEVILERLSERVGRDADDIMVSEEQFRRFRKNFEEPAEDENFILCITG